MTTARREFLKTTATGVAGASLLTMLQARQAPAQIKGTSLRILQWSHFVPAYDTWFDEFVKKWGEQNGVKVRVDRIPHLELPPRFAAEFAAGSGHDLIYFGGWIPAALPISVVDGRWYAVPDFYIVAPMLWRRDLFEQERLAAPDTWEQARIAARTLKAKGHPTGIAFSHCNDANLFLRAILFSHGAREADETGQNILIDSREMREGLKFLKAMFDEGMSPEVFSWDDASDNRFLASGVACWIHDAISAYRSTEDTNPKVFQNTAVALEPQGLPGKRVSIANPNAYAIWKFAKNIPAAKEFLLHLADNWKESMVGSRGYNMPFFRDAYRKPMPVIGTDPKLQILQDFPDIVAFAGYPGPFTPPVQEIVASFIFPDMCTKVARGQSPDEAIKWAATEYRRVYSKYRRA
ncbi:MAG: extracellular solute-binding protein [Candidatus Rokuibacteriota bacterium]|nr:MAG: extracellular solute-binding protein [Candidatus Rokubacteria bacterium]